MTKAYYKANRERLLEHKRNYYKRHREKILKYQKEAYKNNPDYNHGVKIRLRYGITREEYDNMLQTQDNRCAICYRERYHKRRFTVDHCHITGEVRGLLCIKCNAMLGQAEDSIETLLTGVAYLQKYKHGNKELNAHSCSRK